MSDPLTPHPFKDEWSFQRRMTRGNPMAGQPIAPDQPCFTCDVPYSAHEAAMLATLDAERAAQGGLRAAAETLLRVAFSGDHFLTHNAIPMATTPRVQRALRTLRAALRPESSRE